MSGKPGVSLMPSGSLFFDSIFLYRGEFVIDGRWFIPKTAGVILSYEY